MWMAWIVGGVVVAGIVLWLLLVVTLRTQYPPMLTGVRRLNRRLWNPRAMRTAGKPGASTSIIHHVGRNTARPYRTPIAVVPTEDGFVVVLPYGTSADWLKNVVAAGQARIETDGHAYQVGEPEVVGPEVAVRYLGTRDRLSVRIYGVDRFLLVHKVDVPVAAGEGR